MKSVFTILFFHSLMGLSLVYSQTQTIRGIVTDKNTNVTFPAQV